MLLALVYKCAAAIALATAKTQSADAKTSKDPLF